MSKSLLDYVYEASQKDRVIMEEKTYVRKPGEEVKAFQWDGSDVKGFIPVVIGTRKSLKVQTAAGVVYIEPGIWVVGPTALGQAQDVFTNEQFQNMYQLKVEKKPEPVRPPFVAWGSGPTLAEAQSQVSTQGWSNYNHVANLNTHEPACKELGEPGEGYTGPIMFAPKPTQRDCPSCVKYYGYRNVNGPSIKEVFDGKDPVTNGYRTKLPGLAPSKEVVYAEHVTSPKSNGWYTHEKHTMQHYYTHSSNYSACGNPVEKGEYKGLVLKQDDSKEFCPGCTAALNVATKRVETVVRAREIAKEAKKNMSLPDRVKEAGRKGKWVWQTSPHSSYNHAVGKFITKSWGNCLSSGSTPNELPYDPTKTDCAVCARQYPRYTEE